MTAQTRRAVEPVRTGVADRDGVPIAWAEYGSGPVTVLLLPTWSIVHSRCWKAQIPYLARHFRVLTFDARGNGASGRPVGAAAYTAEQHVADAVAVLDATATGAAVLVGFSAGATWGVRVAALHPQRVLGLVAAGPALDFTVSARARLWQQRSPAPAGWGLFNRSHWLAGGFEEFTEFFFAQIFSEPHSSKQIEDCRAWARQTTAQAVADATDGRFGEAAQADAGAQVAPVSREQVETLCRAVQCPVLVIVGDEDAVVPPAVAERLAELTGADLVRVHGGGHAPPMRDPVLVNGLIRDFVDRVQPRPRRRTWTRAARRAPRALYLSSPIGLGHARRDVAIAAALRAQRPDLEIEWLAQHPVTTVLARHGERIHPASQWLASESAHIEYEAAEHDLHAFHAIRRMDETLVANFMVFADLVAERHYDLVIADEAWEVDHFLHENPELKRFSYAWLTDFVGWLPLPDGGTEEAALTADYNLEMLTQRARYRRLRDRSVFVGDPDDIVPDTFGPGLPAIRDWTEQHFDFSGYITGFDPDALDRDQLRAEFGYGARERVCVVTVGGSGVGQHLLRRVLDAVPLVRATDPDLRFVLVAGPRIQAEALPRVDGVEVHGFLPDLYRYLAACDLAIVQGGLTTCMELTARQVPFLYIPLRHHFEQQRHVRHRLDRHHAGRCLDYQTAADPAALAEAIRKELTIQPAYLPIGGDSAAVAAAMLAELL
ncbi:alpha/beta fold hydrolase [Nocardia huaxiensis]|uniref:alpha/beta fold hydrolase n=1 Tax=Nocardia huaxiensis TaxID=2755382 RepID=UPI001E50A7A3|nr:alpha/beta fold hydrolase [Nocardia huaxiensis]UFS98152.1 alpha/beta fold hydrolase [Nocardia huaxiensis]